MSKNRKLRRRIRERMRKTGESYTIARMHILNADTQKELGPAKDELTQPCFAIERILAECGFTRSSEPPDLEKAAELRERHQKRLEERLNRVLKSLFPNKLIPALLTKIEREVKAGASLEKIVWRLRRIPTSLGWRYGLGRQASEIAAQLRPAIDAAVQYTQSFQPEILEAFERASAIQPHINEAARVAAEHARAIQPQLEAARAAADRAWMMQPYLQDALIAAQTALENNPAWAALSRG